MNLEKSKYRLVTRSTHYKFFFLLSFEILRSPNLPELFNVFLTFSYILLFPGWIVLGWVPVGKRLWGEWLDDWLQADGVIWMLQLQPASSASVLLCVFSTPVLDNKSKLWRGMCSMACNHARLLYYLSSNVHWWIPSSPQGIAALHVSRQLR